MQSEHDLKTLIEGKPRACLSSGSSRASGAGAGSQSSIAAQ